ncbi:MAG: MaoC family dehydratase [Alphaproteobacteria bacterium]|nr:MaoC family dehydratase [Alphaproteobacteria bacterium]
MSRYYEDFEVGQRIQTYGRTITDADHALFCALVGYHVPLFIDEEYAKKTRFGGRICPSSLIMSISTAMTESLFRTTVIAQTAADNGRFFLPVKPGDTIRTEVEVLEKRETKSPRSGVVVFRDHVLNQRDEEVFRIDKTVKLARRPI